MRSLILTIALACASAAACAAPPTEQSIHQLLEVTKTEAMIDQVYTSMEQLIKQGIAKEIAGRALSEEQRRAVDLAPARLAEVMRREVSWATLRPLYVAIYQESFDQAEIDGLIAFYTSPVGQSFVSKMPAVMHRSMGLMQLQMQSLMPKIKQAMDELLRDAKIPPRT